MVFPLFLHSQSSLLNKDTTHIGLEPTHMISFYFNYLLKILSPNTVTFWGTGVTNFRGWERHNSAHNSSLFLSSRGCSNGEICSVFQNLPESESSRSFIRGWKVLEEHRSLHKLKFASAWALKQDGLNKVLWGSFLSSIFGHILTPHFFVLQVGINYKVRSREQG